jgi:hypothetical protein
MNSTYKYVFMGDLSNMMSFLLFQMNQPNAVAPTKMCFLHLRHNTTNQSVNMLLILIGPAC